MSTWKRLSNLGRAKLKEGLGSVGLADQQSSDINAMRELERELKAERDRGVPVGDDIVDRAREVRERLEAARTDVPEGVKVATGPKVGTELDRGPGRDRPAGAGKGEKYEPPGPPERLADGTVKRTL